MAFLAEDGTGITNANSYASIAFADSYFLDRGDPTWAGVEVTQTLKEAALIRATDYIETRFGFRFYGEPLLTTQGLHFPATGLEKYSSDAVPLPVRKACCEYALRALAAALLPDPVVDPSGVTVVTVSSKLGPLQEDFEVVGNKIPQLTREYPAADILLRGLVRPSSGRVIR